MPHIKKGTVLKGRYRILKGIAQGGMGVIELAEDISSGKIVVIKHSLTTGPSNADECKKKLENEISILMDLSNPRGHPNVVGYIDSFVEKTNQVGIGDLFLVMNYVKGVTLRKYVKNNQLDEKDILFIMKQVLGALKHIHKHKVIYRDLKPGNILIDQKLHVTLVDFGTARKGDDFVAKDGKHHLVSTKSVASAFYSCPECRITSEPLDERCDIFMAGATLFFMITGRNPDRDITEDLSNDIKNISIKHSNISLEMINILSKSTAKYPKNRYQTVDEMILSLDKIATPPKKGNSIASILLFPKNKKIRIVKNIIELKKSPTILGRMPNFPTSSKPDIMIKDYGKTISLNHIRFKQDDGGSWWIEDLNTRSGTYIKIGNNWQRISSAYNIQNDDHIRVGDELELIFEEK